MKRTTITSAAAVAAVLALTGAQGGCGSSGAGGSTPTGGTTQVQYQGNPASAMKCTMTLESHHPVNKQLTATLNITCNFTVASATSSLVIQGRPLGGSNADWDNVDDPKTTSSTTDISLTYTVPCVTSLEYQASANIDALADDGTPVNASDTTTPLHYSTSECSGS